MADGDNMQAKRGARRVGRPAVISREMILETAQQIASRDPLGAVSILAIARDLKVTPMAIYTYFASKDELMQALTGQLLETLVVETPAQAAPWEKIEIWAHALRRHFLRHPHLIRMISWEGGHVSVAWLNKSKILFEAVEALGLDADGFSRTVLWIWNSVMVAIQAEIYFAQAPHRLSDEDLEQVEPTVARRLRSLEASLLADDHGEKFFKFQLARLTEGLVRLHARGAPATP